MVGRQARESRITTRRASPTARIEAIKAEAVAEAKKSKEEKAKEKLGSGQARAAADAITSRKAANRSALELAAEAVRANTQGERKTKKNNR